MYSQNRRNSTKRLCHTIWPPFLHHLIPIAQFGNHGKNWHVCLNVSRELDSWAFNSDFYKSWFRINGKKCRTWGTCYHGDPVRPWPVLDLWLRTLCPASFQCQEPEGYVQSLASFPRGTLPPLPRSPASLPRSPVSLPRSSLPSHGPLGRRAEKHAKSQAVPATRTVHFLLRQKLQREHQYSSCCSLCYHGNKMPSQP